MANDGGTRRHFGAYQAIEALEGTGEAQLWHAWDPFLGRYVIVAELADQDTDTVKRDLADLDAALRRWTGIAAFRAADVLHFFPGDGASDAYIVLAPGGAVRAVAAGAPTGVEPATSTPTPAARARRDGGILLALAAAAILFLALLVALIWILRTARPPDAVLLPASPPTATLPTCIEPTPTHTWVPTPTEVPTATVKPAAPPKPQPKPAARRPKAPGGPPIAAVPPPAAPLPETAQVYRGTRPGTVTALTPHLGDPAALVQEWLLRHCAAVEVAHREAGRNVACGWMGVVIEGALPEVTVVFTQIDRHVPSGRDLYTDRRFRLLCTERCIVLAHETNTAEVY